MHALALAASLALAATPAAGPLHVGVVDALGPKLAKADAKALGAYLKKSLQRGVEPVVFSSYEDLALALVDGKVDFAWMPPLQGFNAKLGGATIVAKLVRNGSSFYRAVLFARGDSKYGDLASLQGASVAWVDHNSSSGYFFPLAILARAGLNPSKLFASQKFLGSHEAVCRAVEGGKADVGATFADEPPAGQDPKGVEVTGCKQVTGSKGAHLKVVAVSEPVPNDVLVVRQGMDMPTLNALTQVILAAPQDKDGQAVLKQVFSAEGVAPVKEGDFDPVQRALEASSAISTGK